MGDHFDNYFQKFVFFLPTSFISKNVIKTQPELHELETNGHCFCSHQYNAREHLPSWNYNIKKHNKRVLLQNLHYKEEDTSTKKRSLTLIKKRVLKSILNRSYIEWCWKWNTFNINFKTNVENRFYIGFGKNKCRKFIKCVHVSILQHRFWLKPM